MDEPVPAEAVGQATQTGGAVEPILRRPPDIRFEAVDFAYPGRQSKALAGVSLHLRPGRSVALVGTSGAGKSTVANLLLRFIEPDTGLIEVDGRPLDARSLAGWRASVAWVSQRPHLFDGSVADNIRLALPEADDAALAAAARAANASEFIERLPHGFDTAVGEGGARLSGGQRQRLAIARAFLRDAPLLILDEATSHQDEDSEAAIADALDHLVAGRTVLLIAHRLRLAQRADHVVVLDGGRVVEAGAPAKLLARAGAYRRLIADQGDGHAVPA